MYVNGKYHLLRIHVHAHAVKLTILSNNATRFRIPNV